MKNKLLRIMAALVVLLGVWFLLEGGFRVSTAGIDALETLIPKELNVEFPALAVDSSKGDVILAVYQDKRNDDVIYILEYGKNALFDRYALWEWDTWHKSEGSYDSVISSALWNRAYTVEGDTATVWLTRHRSRNVIFSAQLMIFGSILFALTFMKPKGKEEYGA